MGVRNAVHLSLRHLGLGSKVGHSLATSFPRFAWECIPGRFASAFRHALAELRTNPAILCGFEPGDVPGVGTYYDFKKRIIDGPWRKRGEDEKKRSQWNAKSHSRNFKSEKEAKKHELDPNHSNSEILAGKLLENSASPREEGFYKILEDLLFQTGSVPSMESGILTETDKMIVSRDGSIMATAPSAYGQPQCECRKQGICKCDQDRLYSSPTAEWRHNHRTDSFMVGDRHYHLIVTVNGHDFPLITVMPGGNESDYSLSLKAIDRFIKAAEENGTDIKIHAFCGDGHHDSHAHYRYLIEKRIVPNRKGNHSDHTSFEKQQADLPSSAV